MKISNFLFNNKRAASNYVVGQEWYYHTRSHEGASTLKILKIETYEDIGRLIHISVSGLQIKSPHHHQGIIEEAVHLPVAEQALIRSTTGLKNKRTGLPDYEFGYVRWKTAYDEKQAGYFNIPVKEIIHFLETSANR